MLSLADARSLIRAHATALPPVQMSLDAARGRLLREDVRAAEDSPAFDRSAMDGYALGAHDPAERFRVVAEIQPGTTVAQVAIGPGECARVYTGAAIPAGATAVLMQENTRREGEWMTPLRRDGETHIRRRGEDVRAGQTVLRAGTRLGPAELSLLAYLGQTQPLVSPAARVIHVATGRELVPPEQAPAAGEIRDSNSTLIAAELAATGASLVAQSRCGDSLAELVESVSALAFDAWDVLLISGGASVGDYDFGRRALAELGFTIHFDKLDLRPGKPLIFASRGAQVAFVIPGNPVSHFVLFHVAIREALRGLEGDPRGDEEVELPLGEAIEAAPNARTTYWPARVSARRGELVVQPLRWQSSGDLTGLAGVNALIHIPARAEAPVERTRVVLLRGA